MYILFIKYKNHIPVMTLGHINLARLNYTCQNSLSTRSLVKVGYKVYFLACVGKTEERQQVFCSIQTPSPRDSKTNLGAAVKGFCRYN